MTTTRQDIADVLDVIEGVTAYPMRPQTVQPFSVWPEWVLNTPQTMGCEVVDVQWNVWVALPGGTSTTAIEAGDSLAKTIGALLNELGAVANYGPTQVVGDEGNGIPALRYELHTT